MKPKAYWMSCRQNWGDIFTPFLFKEAFGIELELASVDKEFLHTDAHLFSCGSLVDRIPNGFTGHVLGSGIGLPETRRDLRNVQAPLLLRGPLTYKRCECRQSVRFGDPALLASLFSTVHSKSHRYGVVPHYIDKENKDVEAWVSRGAIKIDIEGGIRDVVNAIASCEKIVSSSLHGLVVADSLGVPNKFVKLGRLEGDDFKFSDYYAAYGEEAKPALNIEEAFRFCRSRDVTSIRKDVLDVFTEYVETLKDETSADI